MSKRDGDVSPRIVYMWDFLAPVIDVLLDILYLRWWFGRDDEEHRGCVWALVFFIGLCLMLMFIAWLVYRS